MPTDFHYVPTSGDISGKSVLDQTERAINELGLVMDASDQKAALALQEAENAKTTANSALLTSQEAQATAQDAAQKADASNAAAQSAKQDAAGALARADDAYDLAADAGSRADGARSRADDAHALATKAETEAARAGETADTAMGVSSSALDAAGYAMGVFVVMDEPIDADTKYSSANKLFLTNPECVNFPLPVPLYLEVSVNDENTSATQRVWSADVGGASELSEEGEEVPSALPGKTFIRVAAVTQDEETGTSSAVWSEWTQQGDVPQTRNITVAAPLTGGGSLSSDIAISIDSSSYPEPNHVVQRDTFGRAKVADPEGPADIATKGYVDTVAMGELGLTQLIERLESLEGLLSTKVSQEDFLRHQEFLAQCASYPEPTIQTGPDTSMSEEIYTGRTWIDGRPIFRRFYNCGGLPPHNAAYAQRTKRIRLGINGLDQVTRLEGYCIETNANTIVPIASLAFGMNMDVTKSMQCVFMRLLQLNDTLEIVNNSTDSYYSDYFRNGRCNVTIEYTKII